MRNRTERKKYQGSEKERNNKTEQKHSDGCVFLNFHYCSSNGSKVPLRKTLPSMCLLTFRLNAKTTLSSTRPRKFCNSINKFCVGKSKGFNWGKKYSFLINSLE